MLRSQLVKYVYEGYIIKYTAIFGRKNVRMNANVSHIFPTKIIVYL